MIYGIGIAIGVSGYIPFGNINLGVVELSASGRVRALLLLISGALLSEFVYTYSILTALPALYQWPLVERITSAAVIIGFLLMGFWNFFHRPKAENPHRKSVVKRAVLMLLFHPQQVPFWIIWGTFLSTRGLHMDSAASLALFASCNTLGAGITLGIYALAGKRFSLWVKKNRSLTGKTVAVLCFLFAALELFKRLQ